MQSTLLSTRARLLAAAMRSAASLLLVFAAGATATAAAAEEKRYQLRPDEKNIFGFAYSHRAGNAESDMPFDKPYAELTPAQQATLRSAYVAMGEGDEPPFPVAGLKAIYEPITEGQQRLLVRGTFRADVEVDERGDPVAVAVYRSPNRTVTRFVTSIVMLTKFKPASCAGSPCKMGFPVVVSFNTQ